MAVAKTGSLSEDRGNAEPFDIWTAASLGNLSWLQQEPTSDLKSLINQKNKGGWTPLMYAAYYGHKSIVQFLLENGASVKCVSKSCKNALMMSAMGGNDCCATILLEHGSNVDDEDTAGWTALLHAISYGYHSLVQLFIANGSDVNCQCGPENVTPLMVACESGHLDIVRTLLESGADVQILSSCKQSAFSLALSRGHKHIVALLESNQQQSSRIHCGPRRIQELRSVTPPKAGQFSPSSCVYLPADLETALSSLGLSDYVPLFKQRDISMDQFLLLAAEDLKAIGITKIGPRCKIAALIKKINLEQVTRSSRPLEHATCGPMSSEVKTEDPCKSLFEPSLEKMLPHNAAVHSGGISAVNLKMFQQKLEQMTIVTGNLRNQFCNKECSRPEAIMMIREVDDLANEIYQDARYIISFMENYAFHTSS